MPRLGPVKRNDLIRYLKQLGFEGPYSGGAGFLGSYVVETLRVRERGCGEAFVPRSKDYDLVQLPAVQRLYGDARPDIVIHLAARVGGIGANSEHPAEFFYDSLSIGWTRLWAKRV